jgi:hypothetical protein
MLQELLLLLQMLLLYLWLLLRGTSHRQMLWILHNARDATRGAGRKHGRGSSRRYSILLSKSEQTLYLLRGHCLDLSSLFRCKVGRHSCRCMDGRNNLVTLHAGQGCVGRSTRAPLMRSL